MAEKYLRIDPSGEISWINIDRVPYSHMEGEGLSNNQIYAALDCVWIEIVRTVIPGITIIIDECGKILVTPKAHNELASKLYFGYLSGTDDIVGSAIVVAERPTEPYGEPDFFPLNDAELAKLSLYLGVALPEI